MQQVYTRKNDNVYIKNQDYYGRYKEEYGNLLAVERGGIEMQILKIKS